jgi:TRAP transporter 4TM/12TM fusion protein
VSNIATTGVVTIPLMKKGGYPPHLAGAIEAVASTGGQRMPPVMGAAAFLMAEFLQVPYTQVVLAAIFPAVLYYAALFIGADLEAAKRGITRIDKSLIPSAGPVIKSGWFFSLPFATLIFALFWLNDLPEKAAIRAIVVIIFFSVVFGYKGKRFSFNDLFGSLRSTGLAVLDITMIGAAAGMVIGVLYISGLSFSLTLALVRAAGGNVIILLVASAIVCIILGMGMPTIGVYLLLATLVAPALVEFGLKPMAAHMFIMYYGMMSMITPPVAIGAFAAATLSGADPMRTGWADMRFGWVAFVLPFTFIASPTLLMQGNPFIVLIDFFAALAGVFLVSIGVVGYLFRRVSLWERGAFVLSGLALVLPTRAFNGAIACILLGFFLAIVLLAREILLKKPAARRYPQVTAVREVDTDSIA